MAQLQLKIKRLPHADGIELPSYKTTDSAGMDIRAAVDESILLKPGERALIPTGLQFAIPKGYEGQVRPRSGSAIKHGITMLNSPGTIDADYRGEVKLIVINHGQHNFTIERGERLAQLIIAPVVQMPVEEVEELDETERGEGGFGSTGRG